MPVWYNAENNLGLRVVNGNFVGLKYRVSKKSSLVNNYLKQNNSKTLFELSTNLRTLHHIVSRIKIPAYSTQATLYNLINRLRIASLYPSIFKQGQTSLREIAPLVTKNIRNFELNNIYLKTIVDFSNNFDPQKTAKIVIPKCTKIYWGTEIDEFSNKLSKNMLDQFYYDLMKIISQGTTIYKIKKDDQKKLEQILDFFTIRDYVRIISN